jgi:hypothetical protein
LLTELANKPHKAPENLPDTFKGHE